MLAFNMFAVFYMIATSASVSSNTPKQSMTSRRDVCMLFEQLGLSSYCQDIQSDAVQILNSLYNQERTLPQCIMGLIIHQAVYLAYTFENTYYRVKNTSYSDENLLIVIYEESLIYLKFLLYCSLAFAAVFWVGFVLGRIAAKWSDYYNCYS